MDVGPACTNDAAERTSEGMTKELKEEPITGYDVDVRGSGPKDVVRDFAHHVRTFLHKALDE